MDSTTTQLSAAPPALVQAPSRRLALEGWALVVQTGFALRSGTPSDDAASLVADDRITGQARLTHDRLGRSGASDGAEVLPLTIRAMPEGASRRMLLMLGHGDEAEGFHATLLLPPEVFADLKRDVGAGRAGLLALSATTDLWIAEVERTAPAEAGVTWLLGRGEGGKAEPARGMVERLGWSAPAPVAADAEPAAVAELLLVPETEPPEAIAEALARLNWSLKQIALVLVFLLIVIALK